MKQAVLIEPVMLNTSLRITYSTATLLFCAGLLGPLGFAPFHMPGFTIISLAILFSFLRESSLHQSALLGFIYGMGYFGFGVSWVLISIHDYGQLNYVFSGIATLVFIAYLALFPTLVALCFQALQIRQRPILNIILFSILWCLGELARASLFTGFPWLLVGTTQIDTPVRYLGPIIGIHGMSLLCAVSAALLGTLLQEKKAKRCYYLIALVLLLVAPGVLKKIHWTTIKEEPVTVGIVQANLSMRDKWDEALFWDLLKFYKQAIDKLLGKQLIILPESAIPLPARYLEEYLLKLNNNVFNAKSSLILGILEPTDHNETHYYNSIVSMGLAHGTHIKRHLVPFGEYIPSLFVAVNHWLGLPEPNLLPGKKNQPLITIAGHPVASLICYEIAYPDLLRQQMPTAQWIVSISDNGWFGRSLASYQQLQMAQTLSLLTDKFQILVNNDGLSSVINNQGDIIDGLPPFSSGILQSAVFPAEGTTPWILWGDYPTLIFCSLSLIFILICKLRHISKQ